MAIRRRQKRISDYGKQLLEKQNLKRMYGMREKQFRNYFERASLVRGQTGIKLLETLERRIDNVVFRAGFAMTRAQARQAISHRHFSLNGKRINIASTIVAVGDVIKAVDAKYINENTNCIKTDWLEVVKKDHTIKVKQIPTTTDLPIEFDTQKIIEFYSR